MRAESGADREWAVDIASAGLKERMSEGSHVNINRLKIGPLSIACDSLFDLHYNSPRPDLIGQSSHCEFHSRPHGEFHIRFIVKDTSTEIQIFILTF
jgi:hypothetical protein